jgi:hypothetical protein
VPNDKIWSLTWIGDLQLEVRGLFLFANQWRQQTPTTVQ